MVDARASANKLVIGRVEVDDKPNERAAIPNCRTLDVSGCVAYIGAMGF